MSCNLIPSEPRRFTIDTNCGIYAAQEVFGWNIINVKGKDGLDGYVVLGLIPTPIWKMDVSEVDVLIILLESEVFFLDIDLTDLQGYFDAADEHRDAVVLAASEEWEIADDAKTRPSPSATFMPGCGGAIGPVPRRNCAIPTP